MASTGQPANPASAELSVQQRAAALEAELAALRQLESVLSTIRSIKRKFPSLITDFSPQLHAAIEDDPSDLEQPPFVPKEEVIDSGGQEYGVEKLVAWFQSRNNEPATVQQMAQAIERSEKTIKSILYLRHKGKFVPTEKRGRNNRAYYRLAD